jgi:hypothetical protein
VHAFRSGRVIVYRGTVCVGMRGVAHPVKWSFAKSDGSTAGAAEVASCPASTGGAGPASETDIALGSSPIGLAV